MKPMLSLFFALGLSQSALADAYFACAAPMIGGVHVSPASQQDGGNAFTLTLSSGFPAIRQLGLAPTQDYELRGVLAKCTSNPKAPHASDCEHFAGPFEIKAIGLADGSVTSMKIEGMSIHTVDELQLTGSGSRASVDVKVSLYSTAANDIQIRMNFSVPIPGSPFGTPSQCD